MVDYLISYPKNKFGLDLSCILKVINFLIFRNFSEIFPNFYEFSLDLFEYLKKKRNQVFIMH